MNHLRLTISICLLSLPVCSRAEQIPKVVFSECAPTSDAKKGKRSPLQAVLVVLHGKGGADSLTSLAARFRPSACKHQFLIVAPAAPTQQKNWPFELVKGEGQDVFLNDLLQNRVPKELRKRSAPVELPLLLVGISAGATFLMGDFYPRHAYKFRGKALALCGGSWPTTDVIPFKEKLSQQFPLYVKISQDDFLFDQVRAGLKQYAKLGIPPLASITQDRGHCGFDFNAAIDEVWATRQ